MSKILAISDIHIHDYPQRNPSDKYRLFQTRTVSQNIINVAKNEGAEILVIAGDVLEKSIIRPYVQAEVKLFLDTLMSFFKIGYIIWGNHDQDNKGSDQDFTDSCLSVMLPNNLYYADKKEIVIDNTKIAFSNWRPEFDLTWINNKVDVLFTHATISYSGSDLFKSQVLDESKFDLAICGDIHKPDTIGKYVSIGIPQRCKMSDGEANTGVIFDCETKKWKWVDLNPLQNLMKFEYTSIREEEGWNDILNTWKVYKPSNLGLTNSGIRDIKIPAWEEIDHLINSIIIENNLSEIHGEILKNIKNIESKEVDFNFVLTRFYCKNWRSIDEVELYFNDMDKILITGKNGSGKSSLLTALRYAFEENRFIKDFIQFGSKDCVTEVDFIYQSNLYRIQRGSKKYGLWVNNEPMKYNNKKEFEEDVRIRFPFIDYMDIYFFDSDHHKLIGGITPERKSEIISKFFKMDKIDAYNEEAEILLRQMMMNTVKWNEEIDKAQKLLDYINQRLSLIMVPNIPLTELEKYKEEGLEIQRKSKIWSDYLIKNGNLTAQIQLTKDKLNSLSSEKNKQRKISEVELEINSTRNDINSLNLKISELNSIIPEYNYKVDQLNKINQEGSKLYQEWVNLSNTKICPCCKQIITNSDSLNEHKVELEKRITELTNDKSRLEKELISIKETKEKSEELISQYKIDIENLNNKLRSLYSEINLINNIEKELVENNNLLIKLEEEQKSLGVPEEVVLPDNFMQKMTEIESGINSWNSFNSLMIDKTNSEHNIDSYKLELSKITNAVEGLQRYIKITGTTGKIYEEIMTKLAEQFSDNQVKYEVKTYNFRKKDHLDLSSSFYNNGNWVSYQACSSGQQTVLDVNFLSKIVTRMGLLVMDEFLKHLDPFNHDICIDMISSMNIGCIMISSHMESITSFNNKSCRLELNDSGITKITLE